MPFPSARSCRSSWLARWWTRKVFLEKGVEEEEEEKALGVADQNKYIRMFLNFMYMYVNKCFTSLIF
jgi:hypothetical protein